MSGRRGVIDAAPGAQGATVYDNPVAPPLRWWGWGDRDGEIPEEFARLLIDELHIDGRLKHQPVALEDVAIEASRLTDDVRAKLSDVVGSDHVQTDRRARVAHAAGKSYVDLIRQRSGRPVAAPDAVVAPENEAHISTILAICETASVAVVPFGGGTSVVGGVTPLRGEHAAVIALDMRRVVGMSHFDPSDMTARLRAGTTGPAAEALLNARGLTLGHFPQSFEYATIGGFAAARSAGQASSGYGRFDDMVVGLRCVTPRGTLVVEPLPPNASGPSILQMVLGSEGALGVIGEVTLKVRQAPRTQLYEGWVFENADNGDAAFRILAQSRALPDVTRLSDPDETRINLAMGGKAAQILGRYLDVRGRKTPCLAILGWDGEPPSITRRREVARDILRDHGGIRLGRRVGESWRAHRFAAPYMRDPLIDRGVLVETLETATTWGRLGPLRAAVVANLKESLATSGSAALVGSHVSHIYTDGASLYVTVLASAAEDAVAQWQEAKRRVNDVIRQHGAAVTHHHGVGIDHAPWLAEQIGATGVLALRSLKGACDPAGIMNPGKLLAAAP